MYEKLFKEIDKDSNGEIEPQELEDATKNEAIKKITSKFIVKHSSEWDKKVNVPKNIKEIIEKHKEEIKNYYAIKQHLENEEKRIDNYAFFEGCSSIEGFPTSDKVFHINPIGLVGEFGSVCLDCGKKYNGKIQCTKYNNVYGPVYWGNLKLENYKFWNELLISGKITSEEKDILIGMSPNEGKLDTVQSYDSEILTVGAMQKTINPQGKGEFSIQVQEFKSDNPSKYKELFEDCGWTVSNKTMYYQDPNDTNAKKITGTALKTKIREGFEASKYKSYSVRCKPLEPILRAVNDKDFQAKQIDDFIKRLHKVLKIKPVGYNYTLDDYLNSKLGKATVLDQHVNRPAYVNDDFGDALDKFFNNNPTVDKNPSTWGSSHSRYEKEILDDYGTARRGTDMSSRYQKMKQRL